MTPADIVNGALAILALLLSGFAIWRQRTPRPHWDVTWSSMLGHVPGTEYWRCEIQQSGPGDAERVSIATRVKMSGRVWESWNPIRPAGEVVPLPGANPVPHPDKFEEWDHGTLMGRGKYAWHEEKVTNNSKSYTVEVRVRWSQLPNTDTVKGKVFAKTFSGALEVRQK